MFTGIVTDIGEIRDLEQRGEAMRSAAATDQGEAAWMPA